MRGVHLRVGAGQHRHQVELFFGGIVEVSRVDTEFRLGADGDEADRCSPVPLRVEGEEKGEKLVRREGRALLADVSHQEHPGDTPKVAKYV